MSTFNQSIKYHLEVDKSAVTLIRLQSAHKNDEEDKNEENGTEKDKLAFLRFIRAWSL